MRHLFFVAAAVALAQSPNPEWTGKWRGSLTNWPPRGAAKAVEVTMEMGEFPKSDNTCSMWRTTYSPGEEKPQVKDYQLCRGSGAEDLYVDEGGGLKLKARFMGDVLVSPFKYDNLLLIATLRLRGDILEEEILTVDDQPAVKGPLPLNPKGIQRLVLKRVSP
jgi:hypothetical protein